MTALILSEVGRAEKPVLLKRGPAASIEELLMAAEYVVKEGNARVIRCERGITTFERATRYTLDISAIPVLKQETHLPVIVDPSHAAGRRELVLPLARAAVAAGADGIIVKGVMLRDVQLPQEYAKGLEGLLLKEQRDEQMGVETDMKAKQVRIAELEAEARRSSRSNMRKAMPR